MTPRTRRIVVIIALFAMLFTVAIGPML